MEYFIADGGKKCGPFAADRLAAQGLAADTLVWHAGLAGWTRADGVPALAPLLAQLPPPVPTQAHNPAPPTTPPTAGESERAAAWEGVRRLAGALTGLQLTVAAFVVLDAVGLSGLVRLPSFLRDMPVADQIAWSLIVTIVPFNLAIIRCARALGYRPLPWGLAGLVPGVNIGAALVLNQLAFSRLRAAGVRVGMILTRPPARPPAAFRPPAASLPKPPESP